MSSPQFEVVRAPGLDDEPRSEWPTAARTAEPPIARLRPGSDLHDRVLKYMLKRIRASEDEMEMFYSRWNVAEIKLQAYIELPEWEQVLRDLTNKGGIPQITRLVVPYSFATMQTITTFLFHVFGGRRPIFGVNSWDSRYARNALFMEQKLQYDADHTRLLYELWKGFQDLNTYGLAIWRVAWMLEYAKRTRRPAQTVYTDTNQLLVQNIPTREDALVYEGNVIIAQDPYMFFPDPRVPMTDVSRKGEFVFWRSFEGFHTLKKLEGDEFMWLNNITDMPRTGETDKVRSTFGRRSARALTAHGVDIAGISDVNIQNLKHAIQLDQGTCEIIPRELGLGDSERPEKWMFTIANKGQIIQAAPFDADHDMHPVAVTEPYGSGYSFGSPSMMDFMNPIQDAISWFFNSHFDNVRKSINDMLVVDPSMVEMKDVLSPEPGKLIRLKRAAIGMDVRAAIHQLQVQDVTRGHIDSANEVIRLGQLLTGVNENIFGLQDEGGRKTATEVRTAGQAAASRLASLARIVSSQAIVDVTKMMSLNNQQLLSDEFFISIFGPEGAAAPIRVSPEHLVGDFHYPVSDGTLPYDKVALIDAWKEIFVAVINDPELRARYDIGRIFEYISDLGGARNLEEFRRQVVPGSPLMGLVPDQQLAANAQAGNVIPLQQALGALRRG